MSDNIETHRVQAYRSGIQLLHQQEMSRFQGKTRQETATGKIAFFDQVGQTSFVAKAGRHAPTQVVPVETSRRAVVFHYRETAEFIDRNDITTVINNPMGAIGRSQAAALARLHDQFVADAFFAAAKTGEDGSTSTAFPTGTHQIAHGSAGLTTAKVIDAKKILDKFEVDMTQPRYAGTTSVQLNKDLLNDAQARNSDYNTVRALVTGDIQTWVGFNFSPRFEGLPVASTTRSCPFWARDSMMYVERDLFVKSEQLPTNSYMWQVFVSVEMGATRMDELGVVEVQCTE